MKKVEAPKVREDKKETFDKPKDEGKTTLKQDISKKQKKNLKSAPLNKKKSGVVVKNGCQRIEDGRFFVTYEFNSKKISKTIKNQPTFWPIFRINYATATVVCFDI